MPSLKAIRKRISSVKNTQKITKAMKMVSAAKLRRAQDAVQAIRPYARRLGGIANDLAERLSAEPLAEAAAPTVAAPAAAMDNPPVSGEDAAAPPEVLPAAQIQRILLGQSEQRIRLVVVSADRGLAGAYNSNVFRRTERFITEQKLLGHSVELYVLGKKGRDYFRRRPHKVLTDMAGAEPKSAGERAKELAALLSAALVADQADAVYVVYNEFKNAASQMVRCERLMPLTVKAQPDAGTTDEPRTLVDFLYEPGRLEVLLHLLPLYLETELLRILLEAIAAEFGARMSAMDNASRNAKEMISRLTLQYNRARQAAITKELMEIVGGAEALKG